MHPRLSSSVKWTALPKELIQQIRDIFKTAFKANLKNEKIMVEGRIYPEELLLRVGWVTPDSIRQANFETSIAFNPKKQNALQEIHFAIDVVASMIEEYFTSEDLDAFPRHWEKFQAQGKEAFIQVSTINSELEAQADALLGELDDGLIHNTDMETEREAVVQMLGLDEDADSDDDEGSGSPTRH